MGHKVHPTGFRLGIIRDWEAKWYADRHYREYLQEDLKLRKAIRSMYPEAGVSLVEIDRQANNVSITIYTARPGILIGRGGQRVDEMRLRLEKLIDKRVQLNIREVQQPELDAHLVARAVAEQLERRVAYRRTMKQAMLRSIQAGARGMRISVGGRLDGAEIARRVTMHEGQVPLHTIRADIDYGFVEAHTTMGRLGVKVWIYKGDILPEPKLVEGEEALAEEAEEGAPAVPVEETPVMPAVDRVVRVAPDIESKEVEPEEAPVEVETEAKPTAEVEPAAKVEEKPAKPRTRRATKAEPSAEAEPEVKVAEEAEEKPARTRTRKKKAEPSAEAAVAEEEAPAEAEPAAEVEKKPAKPRAEKAGKAATPSKSRAKKAEEPSAETVDDTTAGAESAEKQGEENVTT
jgi:small subunit ribosomal protein S3